MQEFKPIKEGKVREVYDNGESLIITATDRISAFDHILKNKILDCDVCPLKTICEDIEALRELHFSVNKQ